MEQLLISVPFIKTPYFTPLRIVNAQYATSCSLISADKVGVLNVQRCKDPMRFLFWTFLDILKMSIFGFIKIIFFMRTEKFETKNVGNCRSENGKKNIIGVLEFLIIFKNDSPKNGHF